MGTLINVYEFECKRSSTRRHFRIDFLLAYPAQHWKCSSGFIGNEVTYLRVLGGILLCSMVQTIHRRTTECKYFNKYKQIYIKH